MIEYTVKIRKNANNGLKMGRFFVVLRKIEEIMGNWRLSYWTGR